MLFATTAVQAVSTLILSFSPSWLVFCIMFSVMGFGQISNYVSAFVLGIFSSHNNFLLSGSRQSKGRVFNIIYFFLLRPGAEILSSRVRTIFSTVGACMFFAVGYMLLPAMAFFIRDWRTLAVVLSLPSFLCLPFWW